MQYYWINKKDNKNLIVFFAGWSFDYNPFLDLDCGENDVLIIYDYNNIDTLPTFENYQHRTLISWSMGVFIAYLYKDSFFNFDNKIAVNGTVYPINNLYGIPEKTFDLTLKHALTGLQGKFYQNIFYENEWLEKYKTCPVKRSLENRVEELHALEKIIKNTEINYDNNFYDAAIISMHDKIIPSKNQLSFWGNKATQLDSGHFPFYNYKSWDEICKLTQKQ